MSGSVKLIGQFSHDGIGWKTRLERIFQKNNYNADLIKRSIYHPFEPDETNRNPTPVTDYSDYTLH